MNGEEKAAAKRLRRAMKVGASVYARGNSTGQMCRPCTPTRRPRFKDLIATHLPRRGARSPKAAQRAYAMALEARRQAAEKARMQAVAKALAERLGAKAGPRKGGAR